ncbi:HDR028Cp [Eremothecium sinecaudum]|uniref:HDR028Cp n=1 Tax=Eremothecium sinecaudum TaxID=45286 RepID=A0A0X8HRZ6_9SACH|nr:HDR028Cp [Eremothecium sinecaudum]AMD20771.1 HDR028Cp [Eremothecium sinecaudum]
MNHIKNKEQVISRILQSITAHGVTSVSFSIMQLAKRNSVALLQPLRFHYELSTHAGFQEWLRDTSNELLPVKTAELIELYWDFITVMESKFIVQTSSSGNVEESDKFYRSFQRHIVKRVGKKITCVSKGKMSAEDKYPEFQQVGDQYGVIIDHYGMHFYKVVQNSRVLLAIMDNKSNTVVDLKNWLIMMMEFIASNNKLFPHGCQWLQLYVPREDFVTVKDLRKNLHWIGGDILRNFGDQWPEDDTLILWNDERYVVFRFEC